MPTIDNLKEAFAGESQANRMYLAFSKKAEQVHWIRFGRDMTFPPAKFSFVPFAEIRSMGSRLKSVLSVTPKKKSFSR